MINRDDGRIKRRGTGKKGRRKEGRREGGKVDDVRMR